MSVPQSQSDTLATRVQALEKNARRYRWASALMALLLVLLTGLVARDHLITPAVLKAHSLHIVNSDGRPVVWAKSSDAGHGFVAVRSQAGMPVFNLGVDDDGQGILGLNSPKGKPLVLAGADDNGDAKLALYAHSGRSLVHAGADLNGDGKIGLNSRYGRPLIHAGAHASDQGGALVVFSQRGDELVTTGPLADGDGGLAMYTAAGQPLILASRAANGAAMELYDEHGHLAVQLSTNNQGQGQVTTYTQGVPAPMQEN
ncbi:MAG: hypothetical protein GKR89_17685 [Candidatus Latescibacteria bacterium]|nr:hypothetical protein [Candidatus Latescibacterota bacterium]